MLDYKEFTAETARQLTKEYSPKSISVKQVLEQVEEEAKQGKKAFWFKGNGNLPSGVIEELRTRGFKVKRELYCQDFKISWE